MRLLIALALYVGLAGETAQAFQNEPNGFGPLRFGMSAAAAEKASPQLKRKGEEKFLAIYELENQTVLGLKPCRLDLRFVENKLYEIGFRCEPNNRVEAALEKQFGAPTQHGAGGTVWMSESRSVTLNPASKLFSFTDRPLGAVAQQQLFGYILSHPAQGQPTAPAPTP